MTSAIQTDPIPAGQLGTFARRLRDGATTSLAVTQAYLQRIRQFDPHLQAFEFVDEDKALATARAMDALLAAGTDLGPLMGVPVAIKDVFSIDGYPVPNAGSRFDISQVLDGTQGPFIDALRRAGAVILGLTKSVEFCLGITGVSTPRGTPWNPWDSQEHRIPGGSSSGSGVACAAGLCAFAIGTDTGGSVRVPAAFNGLFGLKTSFGRWPVAGAFPLDQAVDTIGLLTKSAADARFVFDAIEKPLFGYRHTPSRRQVHLSGLRIGHPANYFYDGLDEEVADAVATAVGQLEGAGCLVEPIEVTEAGEREGYFPLAMPASLMALLGQKRFEQARPDMDPVIGQRVATAGQILATDYLAAARRREHSVKTARRYFDTVDVIASPTTALVAPPLKAFDDPDQAMAYALGMTRNTQPSNYLEQCAVSLPLARASGELPIGLQLMGLPGEDSRLLDVAVAVESVLGLGRAPDLSAWVG